MHTIEAKWPHDSGLVDSVLLASDFGLEHFQFKLQNFEMTIIRSFGIPAN